jgi:hypothetical protein
MAGIATCTKRSSHVLGVHSLKILPPLLNLKLCFLPNNARNTLPTLILMNKRVPKAPEQLRIWQQNTPKLQMAQDYVINTARPEDWDVPAIQEPWIDTLERGEPLGLGRSLRKGGDCIVLLRKEGKQE